jgi:hypothetical protein
MMGDDRVNLPEWLKLFALLVGGDLPMDDTRERLRVYGQSLQADFAPSVFTATSARHVARHANPKGFFPRYAEVCAALVAWAKANPIGPKPLPGGRRPEGPSRPGAGQWHGFIAARLVAGGDRAHLLSLARTYASPDELRGIMAAFYPAEAQREEQHAAEVRRDKAAAAAAVVKAAAAALKPAKAPKAAPVQPDAPPPMDPHAPPPPLSVAEMRAQLARLERDAATNDPPPRAAQRIERLRERLQQEAPA